MGDARRRRARGPAWLRRVLGHRSVLPLTALLLRARTVRPSVAFIARELTRRRGAFAYPLRDGRAKVVVRHDTGDVVTLGEVFHERHYEPPAEMPPIDPRLILDLGANVGYFGVFALERWPSASVIGYEPDPRNAAVHARAMELNEYGSRWELRRAAAAARTGELRFRATGDALSHVSEGGELLVAAEDVLPLVCRADLVKLDVEGGEWEILADPRFAAGPPAAIVLEYHPHAAAGADPRRAAVGHLHAAGLTRTAAIFARADSYGMLWAWQP